MGLFGNLFGGSKKENTVIGIDIGSSAIKVVQLSKKKGKAVLDTYGAISLGPYAGEEVGKATSLSEGKLIMALNDILKEAKTTTKNVGMAISFNSSLMTVIELPSASEVHLKEIIPLEAKKYVPVPLSEVSLDWSVVSKDKDEEKVEDVDLKDKLNALQSKRSEILKERTKAEVIKVLIVAIHNDIIRKFENIVRGASLLADFFEIEIFSTLRSVLEHDQGPTMIMDVGAASTKLYVVEKGNVLNSHTVSRGSQDITASISRALGISLKEAEILKRTKGLSSREPDLYNAIFITLDYIFSETSKILKSYKEKNNKILNKVVLVGGGASMKGFAEAATVNLEVEAVSGNSFSKVEAPTFVLEILKNNGPEFAVAVGAALRGLEEE
ncbi:MAG: pilus assembly protein PilM [Patescibacteria group bacterium]